MKKAKRQRRNLLSEKRMSFPKTLNIRLLSKELDGFVTTVEDMVILDLIATGCMDFPKLNLR